MDSYDDGYEIARAAHVIFGLAVGAWFVFPPITLFSSHSLLFLNRWLADVIIFGQNNILDHNGLHMYPNL